MNWSLRVGCLFGIPIDIHITILFFLWPVISDLGLGIAYSIEYVTLIVLSILLHKLGHALTAQWFRMSGITISLHGFGGFATSSGYRNPKQQLMIVLAGPLVTFGIGILCFYAGTLGLRTLLSGGPMQYQCVILTSIGSLNILLGFLNLIPSFPFDGGMAVAALLSNRMHEFKAKRLVAHTGLILNPILIGLGIWQQIGIVIVFGLMGLVSSATTLLNTGGIRFGEILADRRARKENKAARQRSEAKTREYLDDVRTRERDRAERERLRKLFETSLSDDHKD